MTINRVWVVLGAIGPDRGVFVTRRLARAEAKSRNEGPYTWKPTALSAPSYATPSRGRRNNMATMICSNCGRAGIYWKNLCGLSPWTFCPNCNSAQPPMPEEPEEEEETPEEEKP